MKNISLPDYDETTVHEIEVHYKRPLFDSLVKINGINDAVSIFRKMTTKVQLDHKEHFWIMLMNTSNGLLAFSEIAMGTEKSVCVPIKEIFQLALMAHASCIILLHNHPSGSLTISEQDKWITNKICKAAKHLDINVLDHFIITSEGFNSFVENGCMPSGS